MGEAIWTTMKVRYPRLWHREDDSGEIIHPSDHLEALGAYLTEGANDWTVTDDHVTVTFQGEANYGFAAEVVSDVIDWCVSERVPFEAWSDPKYEFDGEWLLYDGHEGTEENPAQLLTGMVDDPGNMLLNKGLYESIISGKHEWAQTVEQYFSPPHIEQYNVEHLADVPRPDRSDDE